MVRKSLLVALITVLSNSVFAQMGNVNSSVRLKELEVPSAPAFIITETAPSVIQSPTTPKEFVLGVAQSFEQSGNGFPQNYSLEFAPYWWFSAAGRNVYTLVGLKRNSNGEIIGEDPFSGLKFTSISAAFLNKDLIPDTLDAAQKMLSIGLRTTIVKVHSKSYSNSLKEKIAAWHSAAQEELKVFQEAITRADPLKKAELLKEAANYKPSTTSRLLEEINEIILQKPLFSWDIAAAHVTYGVGDTSWKSGRSGVWTNLSTYLPLDVGGEQDIKKNYLNLAFSVRFLSDNYYRNDKGDIAKTNVIDVGGKIALDFNKLSVGYEYLKRSGDNTPGDEKRSVGIVNYKLSDNLYINGAFGKNFNFPDKLIAIFGIRWGLGTETISLPE